MDPVHPPLPTPWNLPFQPSMGSQTSILMSESLLRRKVAAMRQKAGRLAGETEAGMNPPAGMLNAPAATVWAMVIVVSGNLRDARFSHVAAGAAAGQRATAAKTVHRFDSMFESIIYGRQLGPQMLYISSKLARNSASEGDSPAPVCAEGGRTSGLDAAGFETADLRAATLRLAGAAGGNFLGLATFLAGGLRMPVSRSLCTSIASLWTAAFMASACADNSSLADAPCSALAAVLWVT